VPIAGDEVTNPNHVAIIAHGNGVNVHHCVFRGLKISVVYWTPGSIGHAMRNCLCHGLYGSAVWTWVIADDLDYRDNVVESCNYVWTASALADTDVRLDGRGGQSPAPSQAKAQERGRYQVIDSYFANNRRLTGPAREPGSNTRTSIRRSSNWSEQRSRTNQLSWNMTRRNGTTCIRSLDRKRPKSAPACS